VTLERAEWIHLVKEVGHAPDALGDTPDERITRTVNAIAGVVAATYPTETMAHVAATSRNPGLRCTGDLLSRFFETETARALPWSCPHQKKDSLVRAPRQSDDVDDRSSDPEKGGAWEWMATHKPEPRMWVPLAVPVIVDVFTAQCIAGAFAL
jgi:hypothetical protein